MGVGMAERRSNAPGIVPARLSHAEKPSSYPHPIPTSRLSPSRYLSHTTFTFCQPILCTGERGERWVVMRWGDGRAVGRCAVEGPLRAALGALNAARVGRGPPGKKCVLRDGI